MSPKKNKIIINQEQLDSLNHWRDQILKMEKWINYEIKYFLFCF